MLACVADRRHAEQVSIGADEYDSTLADDYNNFVNEMVRWLSPGSFVAMHHSKHS